MAQRPVVVVGHGPAGSVLALYLAKHDIPVVLIEKARSIPHDMRASTFHPPTIEMLYALGIGDAAVAKGLCVEEYQYRDRQRGDVATFDMRPLKDQTQYPFRLQLEQWEVVELIGAELRKMPHVQVKMSTRLCFLKEHSEGVSVTCETLDEMETIEASFVVGADGAHSSVRKLLGLGFDGYKYDERFLVVSTAFPFEEHFPNLAWVNYQADPEEWCVLLKTDKNWRVLFPEPLRDGATYMTREEIVGDAFVQQRLQHLLPRDEPYVTEHRSLYEVHQRVAEKFFKGRCALVGDACHVHNPLGGMGMNGGVHDSWMVGMKLVEILKLGKGHLTAFEEYDRSRRILAQQFIQKHTAENKKTMESKDPDFQVKRQANFNRMAADPKLSYDFVFERGMFALIRESFGVKHQSEYLTLPHATGAGFAPPARPFAQPMAFGKRPALLVIDLCCAYTDQGSPFYCPDPACGVVKAVAESTELLEACRARDIPIVFTRVVTASAMDMGVFKAKVPLLTTWTDEARGTQICDAVKPRAGETVLIKQYPSAFFGTPLAANLVALGCDSVLVCGCSTSGCVRATALDALQHGFLVTVVEDCVGDRHRSVHDANLFDIRQKIGNVMPKREVVKLLGPGPAPASTFPVARPHAKAMGLRPGGLRPGDVRVASAQFFSGEDVKANAQRCIAYMREAKQMGAQLLVLPENSNRDRTYFKDGKPSREMCWQLSETLEGGFVSELRAAAKDLGIFVAVGVDLRGKQEPSVHIGSVLIGPDGEIRGVHRKTVLWDYEYTLFDASSDPYKVFDTEIGRLGLLICADGILPETARCLALLGAQVLVNSLNSRGPDERRMHIPCRALENGLWHVSSNTVGNPHDVGLLWPWTGGSQVVGPNGEILAQAGEEEEMLICADITPAEAGVPNGAFGKPPLQIRRPELYADLATPTAETAAAKLKMLGPCDLANDSAEKEELQVAVMQLSRTHTRKYLAWAVERQVDYAARRGAHLGVLPELFCLAREELHEPQAHAAYCQEILALLQAAGKKHQIWLCASLFEAQGGQVYHTCYLLDKQGAVHGKYRQAHVTAGIAAGDALSPVFDTGSVASGGVGRIALMLGHEIWVPEVLRVLAVRGAECVLHPCDWDREEAALVVASERVSENKTHLVSVARMDNAAGVGSQVTFAGEFIGGEPIPLMRYATAQWCRYGVEEQPIFRLKRREPHCKMMGFHLCVLGKRDPGLYGPMVEPMVLRAAPPVAVAAAKSATPDGQGYKKGDRDFTQNEGSGRAAHLKYDFTSPTKEYTNGVVAPNRTSAFSGGLTGRQVPVPDVTSGYPKCKLQPIGNDDPGDDAWFDVSQGGVRDVLSPEKKFMVVVPSTNTVVEQDFWRMLHSNPALDGVGLHGAPILISAPKLASDADMLEFLKQFRKEIFFTIDVGMTAEPEYIVMGMSLETFFGGWVGNQEFIEEIGSHCGLAVATGAEAVKYALDKLGKKKIACLTPYQEIGDKNCVKFFEEIGLDCVAIHGLKCGSATDIAHVPESVLEPILRDLAARPGVEAVVQCGTNLSCVRLMDRLEMELGVAMVPINAATIWFALRENNITAPLRESCRFCRDF